MGGTRLIRLRVMIAMLGMACLVSMAPVRALAGDLEDGAQAFIESLADQAVETLTDTTIPRPKRIDDFRALFNEHFAVRPIGKWILGRSWKRATAAEQDEYLTLFEELMTISYIDRFTQYAGEQLNILETIPRNKKTSTVKSTIVRDKTGDPLRIDWQVGHKDGKYKIVDVVVGSTSMSNTMRSEFGSIIRQHGGRMAGLIEVLRKKTQSLKQTAENKT